MRDAIATGIALILLTFVSLMTIVHALEYARAEGWLGENAEASSFIGFQTGSSEGDV